MIDNTSAFNSNKYDDQIKRTLPYYEEFYKQVIDIVRNYNCNDLTWLDIGCGTGKMAEAAFKETKPERFVFCDCSAEMIEIVRKRFEYPNAEFINSPVQNINFNNEFDVVTAMLINHYLTKDERIAAVKKCYEALKSDGIFISFENFAPYSDLCEKLYLKRWKSYQISQGKSIDESQKHIERYNKDYFPISISEHLGIMKDCGFKAAEILWLSYMQIGLLGIK